MRLLKLSTLLFISFTINAQKLIKSGTDEFTGHEVYETNYTGLGRSMKLQTFTSIKRENGEYTLGLKAVVDMGKPFNLEPNSKFYILLDNDEVITLQNDSFIESCEGCAANGMAFERELGILTSYQLTKEQIKTLHTHHIDKIRLETTLGDIETNVNGLYAKKFIRAIDLVYNW